MYGGRGDGAGGGVGGGGGSFNRAGGYQGGDRGGSTGVRDGDWRCPNPGCGNLNFARRSSCNKCGEAAPASHGGSSGTGGGGRNSSGGGYNSDRSGRGRDTSYETGRGAPARPASYPDTRDASARPYSAGGGGAAAGGGRSNYPPVPYGENSAVPPPSTYNRAPGSYSQSFRAVGGRGSQQRGYDSGDGGRGDYAGGDADPPPKVMQCDDQCGDICDNARIYVSNLPPDVTTDKVQQLFGAIGTVARIKQKRGYKDQWPWSIKLYTDDNGKSKGDGVLTYEDPSAAHSAHGFFDRHDIRGHKISVTMAEKSAPKPQSFNNRGGGRCGYEGGDRRRDYGDGGGPDRNAHGGNRSRPY